MSFEINEFNNFRRRFLNKNRFINLTSELLNPKLSKYQPSNRMRRHQKITNHNHGITNFRTHTQIEPRRLVTIEMLVTNAS